MIIWKAIKSSSKSNCHTLTDGITTLMIDCGARNLLEKVDVSKLDGILISHGHQDHCRNAIVIKDYYRGLFYANKETLDILPIFDLQKMQIDDGVSFEIGTFKIMPFEVYHDFRCFGFLIKHIPSGLKILFITDTSSVSNINFKDIDIIVIEANHSYRWIEGIEEFDFKTSRTYGEGGHLAVEDTMEFVNNIANVNTKKVILTHISSSCKNYKEIEDIAKELIERKEIEVIALDNNITKPLEIVLKEDIVGFDFD